MSMGFFSEAVLQYKVVDYPLLAYPVFCSVEASASMEMLEALPVTMLSTTRSSSQMDPCGMRIRTAIQISTSL